MIHCISQIVAHTNEEVWAAKARAWAAAKAASDNQQPQQLPYAFQDGTGDSAAVFPGRDSSISPSVHQQEVPSSYSSIAGKRTINTLLLHMKLLI